ncbi:signal peptidase I [Blautia sp. XA-2221]|uniref:signal peptidase I n=1 Tax=Blautia sp. XA-2221 TaxID=2903961 RepID=UPI002378DFC2|nr:signal peptidase I [Blautia sp. XA-2221]
MKKHLRGRAPPKETGTVLFDQTGKGEHMKKREYAGRFLLAVIAGVFLLPAVFKRFSVNIVLSGSMEPALKTGGIIFTDTKKNVPGIGDIITYRLGDMLVTHRVTDKRDSAYITRGDANEGEDAAPVMQEQIVGTVVFFIPVLGYVAAFLQKKPIFGLISLMLIQELFFLGMQWKGVCRQFCKNKKYEKISRK